MEQEKCFGCGEWRYYFLLIEPDGGSGDYTVKWDTEGHEAEGEEHTLDPGERVAGTELTIQEALMELWANFWQEFPNLRGGWHVVANRLGLTTYELVRQTVSAIEELEKSLIDIPEK